MLDDVLMLSRVQFAITIMFHYLFPPLSIGLGTMMVIVEGLYRKTGNKAYESIARFLTGIFAIVFAMGVASGIVMEFQFGTNWAAYSRFVGDVFGSALAAEGIFAFFLESGFLAVLVFGWDRVSPGMHFFSTCMVALGAVFSSVWITVANSWQQTPAGHHVVAAGARQRAEIVDFWAMVLNPSSVHRLVHVWIGALILGAFFVMSISAFYILKGRHGALPETMFKVALAMGLAASLAAPISGHFQAATVARLQPAKLAAFEGHFATGSGGTPLNLFGIPDREAGRVRFAVGVPGLLSFLVHGDFHTPVVGLDQIPRKDWPPVAVPFASYHLMVALGMLFVASTLVAAVLLRRRRLFEMRPVLWFFVFAVIAPYLANELGWAAAEVGRQPWIVSGLLRTADGVSPAVDAGQVLASTVMFSAIYVMLFLIWVFVLDRKIRHGPEPVEELASVRHREPLIAAAAQLADPSGPSMTAAREGEEEESEAGGRGKE